MNEAFMDFRGYKTWYAVYGNATDTTPLFVLHGGPGYPHNSLNNTSDLSKNGYQVVLYDQLGCGLSDRPDDPRLWVVDTFVDELDALRRHLGFEVINILGQSWGGSLALEYTSRYPEHVTKLVLHSPLIDTKLWVAEADRLKDLLPDDTGARMRQLEQSGETASAEYNELSKLFNDNFCLRLDPVPQEFTDMVNNAGEQVYSTMWGPSEAFATGNLKDWSVVDKLKTITKPTLLISGQHDEATPAQMQVIANSMPNIRWELFTHSSHSANLEEPERYLQTVTDFLGSTA